MKFLKSTSGIWSTLLLICITALATNNLSGQQRTVDKSLSEGKVALVIGKYTELPEATGPCKPVECEWWRQIREAGNQLQQQSLRTRSKRKFVELFIEGLEANYRVPVEDSGPHILVHSRPDIKDLLRSRKVSGEVRLIIEYRFDGSIGDIIVESGIAPDIDSRVIQAKQQQIFLPAIRDGKFVTEWAPAATKISTSN